MNTFLIISKNSTQGEEHAITMAKDQQIHHQDIVTLSTEGSIGIETVRNFQKQIILKPMRGENKAVIITDAHTLTIEAQNALLKTLEEPPEHTYIFLTAENSDTFLPTILSRASIITISQLNDVDKIDIQETAQQINIFFSSTTGERLAFAETLASDKQKALSWIEKATYIIRNLLLEKVETEDIGNLTNLLESLQKTYVTLKITNVNLRLALENLFLNS